MKKRFTILIAVIAAILMIVQPGKVFAQERATTTYTMTICSSSNGSTNVQWTSTSQTSLTYNNVSWTPSVTGTTSMTSSTTYAQIGSKNSPATQVTLSTTAFAGKKITAASLTGFCMSNTGPALTITAGSTNILSNVALNKTDSQTYSTANNLTPVILGTSSNNTLTFTINSSAKAAICISQISVTYVEPHTITFNGNGGTYNAATSYTQTVFDGEATNLTTNQFTYADHNFLGWKDANNNEYTDGQSVSLTANLTLTAQWEAIGTDPYITTSDVNVAYTATEGSISYTVNNFQSGTMTATTTADWLTIGTVTGPHATEHTGTVPFTMNANAGAQRSATVTLSYDFGGSEPATKEVTVTQAVAQYTVTYNKNDNGASGEMSDDDSPYNYGSTVTVLENEFTAPTGKVFDHWSTASDGGDTYDPDDEFTIIGNVTLYAQWRSLHTYTLVTSTDQIVPGKHYIIANSKTAGSSYYAMGGQNSNYRNQVQVTVNVEKINNEDHVFIYETANVSEIIICGTDADNFYTIYDANDSKYLQAPTTSGSDNYLNESSTLDNAKGRWLISFGDTEKNAIFAANHTGKYIMRYNSTNTRFSCYGSTNNMADVFLYLKDNDTDGTIYSATTLSKNVSYNNLTIVKTVVNETPVINGSVTVPNNKTLTVTGTLNNQGSAANLVIEDGGQLIASNSVAATVKKSISAATITPSVTNWYAISSSAHDSDHAYESISNVSNLTSETYDMFYYKESTGYWMNQKNVGGAVGYDTLQMGRGYIYRNAAEKTLSFTGVTQSGSVKYPLTYTTARENIKGFHLIGNPYTHDVYKGENAAIPNTYLEDNFYTLTSAGGWEVATDNSTVIKPNMAVLVQATSEADGKNLVITKTTNQGPTKAGNDMITFMVKNSEYNDATYVFFKQGRGLNKIEHKNPEIPMLYINHNDESFAVVDMDDNTRSFNLNFKAMTMGKYTFSYKAKGNFSYLHVIDRLTGNDVDMLLEGEYSFIAAPGDNENRFIVVLEYLEALETLDGTFAYQNGNDIIVNGEGNLQIFDVMGRLIATKRVNGVETVNVSTTGVYIFKLNEKTQKIVVR